MRHDDNSVLLFKVQHQLFDLCRGNGVERRARLIHQQNFRFNRQRARDTEALLLATGESQGRILQPVRHFIPEGRPTQAALDNGVELVAMAHAEDAWAVGGVLVDRLGKRVRL